MFRLFVLLVPCSAVYGFSIGIWHSWTYAGRNLVKFPLLLLTTSVVCAFAYFVLARFLGARLGFWSVQRWGLQLFADTAAMLASLAPVSLFLALTLTQPSGDSLGDYALFQGANVGFIAIAGSLALFRQSRALLRGHALPRSVAALVVSSWLCVSLVVGGQASWYLRPFFGISSLRTGPWFLGTTPDFRGATNFFEAVRNLADPPRTGAESPR